nr:neuropeptide-like 1 isoform X1 [Onthophagus taurus]
MGKIISEVSVVLWLFLTILVAIKSEEDCDPNFENILKLILDPNESSLQQQALRAELVQRVKEALQREEFENELVDYKRSLSSLARWDNLPGKKRNLESLARAGYIRTLPDDDQSFKRSISSLIKAGQLPSIQLNDDLKRGIQSLARNGELHYKRENQRDHDEYDNDDYDKRNIASLAKSYNFPVYKRNVAALLRQDSYLNGRDDNQTLKKPFENHLINDKRNIGSIKAQYKPKYKRSSNNNERVKRNVDYDESFGDIYREDPIDYEEMLKQVSENYENPEKRFLGSVAKTGWFRPSVKLLTANKRHIGALARLGWLPTLRSIRRFNRSGRSSVSCDSRPFTANGKIQNNAIPEVTFELMDKQVPSDVYLQYRDK